MNVSVIVAVYNGADVIERALHSVIEQSMPAWEILVVDDCSTDDTRAVVSRMAERHPAVRLLGTDRNGGPSKARNLGIDAAAGSWVAILDADDAWKPNRLEHLTAVAEQLTADLVTDNQVFFDAVAGREASQAFTVSWDTKLIGVEDLFENDVLDQSAFPYSNFKPVFSKTFLDTHRLRYSESYRYGEDFLMLAEVLFRGGRAAVSSVPTYIYTTRVGEFSKTVSPHSQSTPSFDRLVNQSDWLKARYRSAMTPRLERAMEVRRSRLAAVHLSNVARTYRRNRQWATYTAYVVQHPALLRLLVQRIYRKLGR